MSKNTQIRTGATAAIPSQNGDRNFVPDNSVSTQKLQDSSVSPNKLQASAVTPLKLDPTTIDYVLKHYKNYLMNGDMRISQRNATFTAIANAAYCLDRYTYTKSGTMVHTITQDTDVPTFAQVASATGLGYLFQNSLRLNLTTADTSIAGADQTQIGQIIEGYNYANFAQKSFTLSFWVKATLTGVYCVNFRNSGNDRSYVAEYTINTTNTWEYKTINVPAPPSAGTWDYATGAGLKVNWVLATTATTTPGSWQTGTFLGTANQVNGVNTGATDFRLTGIMLNEGDVAIPFRLFASDWSGEQLACYRYFEKSYDLASQIGSATANGVQAFYPNAASSTWANNQVSGSAIFFKAEKIANPTVTYWSEAGVINTCSNNRAAGFSVAAVFTSKKSFCTLQNSGGSQTITNGVTFHWSAEAEL